MVVAGLGMALAFAGATKAQEIVNTSFADGPNVAAFPQPAASTATTNAADVAASQPASADSLFAAAEVPASDAEPSDKLLWIGCCLVWLGAIGLYFSGPAKRFALELRVAQANSTEAA